jgi:hypothetical protein
MESKLDERRSLLQSLVHVVFLGVPHDMGDTTFTSRWANIIRCTTDIKLLGQFDVARSVNEIRKISGSFNPMENVTMSNIVESVATRVSRGTEKIVLVLLLTLDC